MAMERRTFIKYGLLALAAGVTAVTTNVYDRAVSGERQVDEHKLWKTAMEGGQKDVPLELAYAKDTPVFYRDASLGTVDPGFIPRTGGG